MSRQKKKKLKKKEKTEPAGDPGRTSIFNETKTKTQMK